MKIGGLLVLAFLAFAFSLVLEMPAGIAYAWLQPPSSRVQMHGVDGTLRSGGFAALTVDGRPVLRDASWTLRPAWLALLRLSADLQTRGDAVVRARVSRAVFGTLRIDDLEGAGSIRAMLGMLGQASLPMDGQVRLALPLIRLDGGVPVEAEGSAEIDQLRWTLAREPLVLGSFTATLATDDKGIQVQLGSGPGPLELTGSVSLAPTRAYDLHLQLRPRGDAAPPLQSLVRSLGTADAQGWYHVRRSGTL